MTHADVIAASVLRYTGYPYTAAPEIEVGFCSVWTLRVVGAHVSLRYLDHAEIAARVSRDVA